MSAKFQAAYNAIKPTSTVSDAIAATTWSQESAIKASAPSITANYASTQTSAINAMTTISYQSPVPPASSSHAQSPTAYHASTKQTARLATMATNYCLTNALFSAQMPIA